MKKVLLAMIVAISVNFSVKAEEFTAWISDGANIAFCVYPQAFFSTEIGKIALEKMKAQKKFEQFAEFEKAIGANISEDVSRFAVAFLGEVQDADQYYTVIESKIAPKKIEAALASKKDEFKNFTAETVDGVRQLSFTSEINDEERVTYVALLDGKTLIAMNLDALKIGIATVNGKAKNIAGDELFKRAKVTAGTALLEGAAHIDGKMQESNAQMAEMEDIVFSLANLDSGKNQLKIVAKTKSENAAQQYTQQLAGMKMIFTGMLPQLVEKIEIQNETVNVVISLTLDKAEIAEIAKAIADSKADDEDDE